MKQIKSISMILVLCSFLSIPSIFSIFSMETLIEQSARIAAQELMKKWDNAWRAHKTDFNKVKEAVNAHLAGTSKDIRNYRIAPQLFEINKARILQLLMQRPIKTIKDDPHFTQDFKFDPQSKFLASAAGNNISFWHAETFLRTKSLPHNNPVEEFWFSKNGDFIASTVENDNRIWLWNRADNFENPTFLEGHTNPVNTIAFDPRGEFLVSADSVEPGVRLWDLSTNEQKKLLAIAGVDNPMKYIGFTPEGNTLIAGTQNTIGFWKRQDLLKEAPSPETHAIGGDLEILRYTIDPQGNWLATALSDHTILLKKLKGPDTHELTGHTNSITHLSFNPSGTLLASTSNDNTVRIWDLTKNFAVTTFTGHTDVVNNAVFNPQGTLLLSTSLDETIRIWDPINKTAEPLVVIPGHAGWSQIKIKFHPQGLLFGDLGMPIFVCAAPENIRLWMLPAPNTFNFNQLLYLLAIVRIKDNPDGLNQDELAQLRNNLKVDEFAGLFKEPSVPGWFAQHIDTLFE